jgi:hypothetical protein
MAMSKPGSAAELNQIQRQMGQMRHEMHAEVQGAVRGAQSLADWRNLVSNHPWAAVGIAAVVGYLVVPHRRLRSESSDAQWAAAVAAASRGHPVSQPVQPAARLSLFRSAFSLVTPVLIRAAQNYVLGQVEQVLASNVFGLKGGVQDRGAEPGQTAPSDQESAGPTIRFRERR